jgi:DnaJ-class molecular chaperone
MAVDDPYRALGVSPDASDAEIKRAYRRLARQHHPDRNPDDAAAEDRFKAVQAAYDAIGTAEARREFDEQKRIKDMFGGAGGFRGGAAGADFGGADFADILKQMMGGGGGGGSPFRGGGGGSIFDQFGGPRQSRGASASGHRSGSSREEPARGREIRHALDIDIEQATNGGEIPFRLSRLRRCRECKGSVFGTGRRCVKCDGRGVERRSSTVRVKIPAAVEHGHELRLRGLGDEHPAGNAGDLTLHIRIDAGEGRRWEDGNLVQSIPLTFSILSLGGRVRLRTPADKQVEIDVPEGSRIGDRRRLAGQGVAGGALDIEFILAEPTELTAEQRAAIEVLRDVGL